MISFTILASSALSFMAVQTDGFAPSPKHQQLKRIPALNNAAAADATDARINQSIDLDSPKVVTQDKLESGKKVYCRCWQSGTFPLCDGAHVAHNKETGDNVGPLILAVAKAEPKPDVDASAATDEKVEVAATEVAAVAAVEDDKKSTSLFGKFKALFKNKNDDGTTTKEKLAKMGLSALLSYGFVSNMSYAVALSLSWYGFSKKTGLSPLAPGQWKPFLAVYAGFYVFNNIVRPVRLGLSVAVAKYFDAAVEKIQTKTKLSRKWSIAVVVFLANVCGTFAAMGLGVSVASGAAGVPIFPPKVVV